nr:Sec-independent protein translocase protein TatB [uncultured Mailhella sp.]
MFGIGSTELLVILVVALLVLGPKNLPKIAHTLGRAMGEFRRVSTEFQRSLNTEIAFEEEEEKAKAKKAAEREKTTSGSTGSSASETENKA